MGFFDRFKGESAAGRSSGAERPVPPRLPLTEIARIYGLKEKESYEPSIEGDWWEGETGATWSAVLENGGRLFVHIGTIAEITDIYLDRATAQQPLPPEGSPARIDSIVQGHPARRCSSSWPILDNHLIIRCSASVASRTRWSGSRPL